MVLSDTAQRIFKMKYAIGEETWEEACYRVADHIAQSELRYNKTPEEVEKQKQIYFNLIYNLIFIPGGRVLANAGAGIKSLMNCFALPIEDSRASIYSTLKNAAEIFANGGGIGFNFSKIREEGALINSTGGKASGPLSFMTLFDQTGEVIQQASRRGAQIGLLSINHPDIEKFIDFKAIPNTRNERILEEYDRNLRSVDGRLKNTKYYDVLRKTLLDDQLTHFNISVVITDDFMKAVQEDKDWDLISPSTGEVVKTIKAVELLNRMANRAWESGDPGVFFYDRTNEDNLVPYIGDVDVTNPCAEVPLLPEEPCCLGSLNLASFVTEDRKVDLEFLEYTIRNSIRFLDSVQDVSETPIEAVNRMSKGLRRVGLGVFGWADMLVLLRLPYDSEDAVNLAEFLSWFMSFIAWQESSVLAEERGKFPMFEPTKVDRTVLYRTFTSKFIPEGYKFDVENMIVRNVSVTSLAPTGSIALLAGRNSSIEPFFALAYRRNITEGVGNVAKGFIIEINPLLFDALKEEGLSEDDIEEVKKHVLKYGSLQDCPQVSDRLKEIFKVSSEIHWTKHVDMQSAWQSYTTNAVSKTINCSNDTTVEDIKNIYMYMWQKNLKGGTVYRDGSKSFQILNKGVKSG